MRSLKRVLLLLLAMANTLQSNACDVCGSVGSSQNLGLLPQFSKHFIGIQYQYASSESNHPSLFAGKPNEQSQQIYNTTQLWGRYQIAKRVQLFCFLPHIQNVNKEATQTTNSTGLGDATLMVNYSILKSENKKQKRLLLFGAGIKLPTGKYTGISTIERYGVANIQTGTGSYDFLSNINYTEKRTHWGYNVDATYTFTTANKEQYKFGNRLNTAAIAFIWLEQNALKIVPQAGVKFEYSLHDYDNYPKKWLNEKTGGSMAFATLGSQLFYKKIGLKATIQLPIHQNFAAGYVHNNTRYEGGIFILF